jgi:hypothetical protein
MQVNVYDPAQICIARAAADHNAALDASMPDADRNFPVRLSTNAFP